MWTDRTEMLVGKNGISKLKNSHVVVIGIGGVGGYVCVMLARAGVGELTIMDFDKVDETNINRQIVANLKTVGKFKTAVMKKMILDINKDCKVNVISERLSKDNLNKVFANKYDIVVDAIDSVADKVELIAYCKENGINIISAMGAGNRIDIPTFEIKDIYETSNDGLSRIMRKQLKKRGIQSLDVVCSTNCAIKTNNRTVGSISYYPAMCGCVIAAHVIKHILGK